MAWTQSDLDALETRISTARKSQTRGDRSVTDYDIDQLLALRDAMKGVVDATGGSGGTTGSSTGRRSTYASFNKD